MLFVAYHPICQFIANKTKKKTLKLRGLVIQISTTELKQQQTLRGKLKILSKLNRTDPIVLPHPQLPPMINSQEQLPAVMANMAPIGMQLHWDSSCRNSFTER